MNYMKRKAKALALIASAAAAGIVLTMQQAMAAVDLTPITSAQTDLLAYAAALLALGVAVWGALKVVKMFGGR